MKSEIIYDPNSRFRSEVLRQYNHNELAEYSQRNAYGTVVSRERVHPDFEIYRTVPIICGHGGSMWLCKSCADCLLAHGWKPEPKTNG